MVTFSWPPWTNTYYLILLWMWIDVVLHYAYQSKEFPHESESIWNDEMEWLIVGTISSKKSIVWIITWSITCNLGACYNQQQGDMCPLTDTLKSVDRVTNYGWWCLLGTKLGLYKPTKSLVLTTMVDDWQSLLLGDRLIHWALMYKLFKTCITWRFQLGLAMNFGGHCMASQLLGIWVLQSTHCWSIIPSCLL